MKTGCNFIDQNNIRDYVEAGNTNATQIGNNLGIEPTVVQKFIDHFTSEVEVVEPPEAPAEDTPELEVVAAEINTPTRRRRAVQQETLL